MTITEAKVRQVTKELAEKLTRKEITSQQCWDGLDEIELFKMQNNLERGWERELLRMQ